MAAVLEGRPGIDYHSLLTKIVFYCIVIPSKTVYHKRLTGFLKKVGFFLIVEYLLDD